MPVCRSIASKRTNKICRFQSIQVEAAGHTIVVDVIVMIIVQIGRKQTRRRKRKF